MSNAQKTVLIVGTCDSKGEEILFMKKIVESEGRKCLVLDLGLKADPEDFTPDITRKQLSEVVGSSLDELMELAQKGRYEVAVEKLGSGSEVFIQKLYKEGTIDGILVIGGSMGTALGLRALRALPVGFPKVLVSTVAISEYLHPYFIPTDLTVVQPVSDFVGVNQWSKRDLTRAARTICATLEEEPMEMGNWIGMPAIGWSSHAATTVKKFLEKHGYKVAAAHSVSMQTGILEQLIRQDVIKGMVDLCHFEILHEIAGAALGSKNRLTAGVEKRIPMILAPNTMVAVAMCTIDMPKFEEKGRVAFEHNEILGTAAVSNDEMIKTAEIVCSRLNKSQGKIAYVVPKQGFCAYDNEGQPYFNPEGRAAFIDVLKKNLDPKIQLDILDCHWDDQKFEDRVCELSLEYFADLK